MIITLAIYGMRIVNSKELSARDTSNKCIPLKTPDKHHTGTWYGVFSLKSRRADYTMGDITYGRRVLVLM